MVLAHGLAGASDENYIRSFAAVASARGWRVVVYNRRGHGDAEHTSACAASPFAVVLLSLPSRSVPATLLTPRFAHAQCLS